MLPPSPPLWSPHMVMALGFLRSCRSSNPVFCSWSAVLWSIHQLRQMTSMHLRISGKLLILPGLIAFPTCRLYLSLGTLRPGGFKLSGLPSDRYASSSIWQRLRPVSSKPDVRKYLRCLWIFICPSSWWYFILPSRRLLLRFREIGFIQ